jgi:hypothetical protein
VGRQERLAELTLGAIQTSQLGWVRLGGVEREKPLASAGSQVIFSRENGGPDGPRLVKKRLTGRRQVI